MSSSCLGLFSCPNPNLKSWIWPHLQKIDHFCYNVLVIKAFKVKRFFLIFTCSCRRKTSKEAVMFTLFSEINHELSFFFYWLVQKNTRSFPNTNHFLCCGSILPHCKVGTLNQSFSWLVCCFFSCWSWFGWLLVSPYLAAHQHETDKKTSGRWLPHSLFSVKGIILEPKTQSICSALFRSALKILDQLNADKMSWKTLSQLCDAAFLFGHIGKKKMRIN